MIAIERWSYGGEGYGGNMDMAQEFEGLRETLAGLSEGMAEQRIELREIQKDVTELKHALLGNGRPGLVTEVATLAEKVSSLESAKSESKAGRYVIWAAVITGGISFLEMLLRHVHA